MECVFCNVNEIKNQIFYESKHFIGIVNIKPLFEGQSLLIPKRHVENYLDLNEEELKELPFALKEVLSAVIKTYQGEGFDLLLQNGKVAGQVIPHIHFHLCPRKKGDIPDGVNWFAYLKEHEAKGRELSQEEMKEKAEEIKKVMG